MASNSLFGKMASDAMGLSDIGRIIPPSQFNKVDGDDYIMHEDGEEIYFVIKSKSDEYVFTNYGLLHVDGTNALSKRRTVVRYDFLEKRVSNVTLETAGTVDLDVEIKFTFGETAFSIDVNKADLEGLKDLYKTLIEISKQQELNDMCQEDSREALTLGCQTLNRCSTPTVSADLLKELVNYNYSWLKQLREINSNKDFGYVFQKYINN